MTTLHNDAEDRSNPAATPYYGFTSDPNSSSGVYYGYLEYAGGLLSSTSLISERRRRPESPLQNCSEPSADAA